MRRRPAYASGSAAGACGVAGLPAVPDGDGGYSGSLLPSGRFEFDHQLGRHPAAVFYLDALCPGPLADLGRVQAARRPAAAATGRPAGAAAGPAGSIDVPGQRIPQFPGVPGVQVDLILGAVQPEPDGTSAALPSMSSLSRVWIF